MAASLESWLGTQKACKLLTEKAKEACRGRTQLRILPGFCQRQHTAQKPVNYSLLFSLVKICSVRDFWPAVLCVATTPPDENGKKARKICGEEAQGPGRPGITAGLQCWLPQPSHEYKSEMSDIPCRIKYGYLFFYGCQNSAGVLGKSFTLHCNPLIENSVSF